MYHIFLVEDDRALSETLAQMLTDRDFKVTCVRDFRRIAEAVRESGFQGVLTFEIPPSPPENSAEQSLDFIKQLLSL